MKRLFALLAALLLLLSGQVAAENLYVAPVAAGSADGSSSCSNAWGGLGAVVWGIGAGKVSAGDTLYVCPGTYSIKTTGAQLNVGTSGSVGNPITITAADTADKPVLDGAYVAGCTPGTNCSGDLINNSNGRIYIIVQNLILQNCAGNDCIIMAGTQTGSIVQNNIIRGTNIKYGVYGYQATNLKVLANDIAGCRGVGIYVYTATNLGTADADVIQHNAVHDNPGVGIRVSGHLVNISCGKPALACQADSYATNAQVLDNTVYGNGSGIYHVAARGVLTQDNLVYGNIDTSVVPVENYGMAGEICDQCSWVHNEVYGNASKGLETWGTDLSTTSSLTVARNYIHGNNTRGTLYACELDLNHDVGDVAAGSNINIYSNIFVGTCVVLHGAYTGVTVYNNTLYGGAAVSGLSGLFLPAETFDLTLKNNIIRAINTYTLWSADAGISGTFIHTNNAYFTDGAVVVRSASINYTAPNWEASAIASDLLFQNASGVNGYQLQPTSPALRAGTFVGPYHDYLNRRFREPPSIGAFEQASRSIVSSRTVRN